jgi:heterodisulfide reductase subunit A
MEKDRVKSVGAVLVAGGGIAGVQASLDLAESGFFVYLVEERPSIGGVMAQLDKTFPTNDCSMCIMSPKLVECGRHLNIEVITFSEIIEVKGRVGNFKVKIRQKARYVDIEKCVGCGVCAEKCPSKVDDAYNENMGKRKAIYIEYPQAVPLSYIIDGERCLKISKGKCGVCEKICKSQAINYEDKDKIREIEVGSILLTPGFEEYNDNPYSKFQNVVTSIQFERMLSSSGPFKGHVVRPSDHKEPQNIAFIQCVGSRDVQLEKGYCSSVCCMYAIKEAIIAKEHAKMIKPTIFYMDIRAYGKGFEAYYKRAEEEYNVRFKNCKIQILEEDPETKNIYVKYVDEEGTPKKEEYDLVVLSVGLTPTKTSKKLKEILGIKLNDFGFCKTDPFTPLETSVKGVFVSGVFQGPKDIPETVAQSSGASICASSLLSESRKTLTKVKEYPPERDITGIPPRIGVIVCRCGINIGSVVDVEEVRKTAETLPNVVYTDINIYACSQDSQEALKEKIKEYNLNRVVVASCSPRTHEPMFQETLLEVGLNKYLFELINIRDQCSWVHSKEPEKATQKAKELVVMAVAKARNLTPLSRVSMKVNHNALVIGGGLSGMIASLSLANQGFRVALVEKKERLGGNLNLLSYDLEGNNIKEYLSTLIDEVKNHKLITVYKNSEVTEVEGFVGNFRSKIKNNGNITDFEHGAVIIATGASEYKPKEYFYGEHPSILTQLELEEKISKNNLGKIKNVVMIQCVGSRNHERTYCSRICCAHAVKNALAIKRLNRYANIIILAKDIRTYGFKEIYFQEARDKGVSFVKYNEENKPEVEVLEGELRVKFYDPLIKNKIELNPDLLVLSSAVISQDNQELAKMLKVPINADGFYLEAHTKLRPVEFGTDGVFVCGLAHSPGDIPEKIAQAHAAASKATVVLSKDSFLSEGTISYVKSSRCTACGMCESLCAYKAIEIKVVDERTGKKAAVINEALCKGCGACSSNCRCGAIDVLGFTKEQIYESINALLS